jgi:hypothetical protein
VASPVDDLPGARRARARRLAQVAALAVLAAAVALAARPAPAKEHTASCLELSRMIGRVRATLQAANTHRQRGSSLGAYQVLHATVASMAHDSVAGRCGALGPTLNAALARASNATSALDASLELDRALDATLTLASEGKLPRDRPPLKLLPVGEAALYGTDCPDLFALAKKLDAGQGTLAERVAAILADLRAHPRCAQVRRVLERATPDGLAHAADSVRLDEPEDEDADAGLAGRCPELPLVMERLGAAISVGAPQYNAGDAAACRHTYEQASAVVATQVIPEGRCPTVRALLAAGRARAKGASDDRQAAWDLRHSFDAILSEDPGSP